MVVSWKQFLFRQIFYFETGKGKVIGRAYSWWNEVLIIFIFLKQMGFNLSYTAMVSIVFFGMIAVYISGRWYIKKDYHKYETSFYNQQNPEITAILEKVNEKK